MNSKPILYYAPGSPPSRTCIMVAKAINFDLELKLVDLAAKEHLKPAFLKLNPQHTVPTLDDNGLNLWDSHAISIYLIEKYASKNHQLYPTDPYIRARITQRLQFNTASIFSILREIIYRILYLGEYKIKPQIIQQSEQSLNYFEQFLTNDLYLVGNQLTLADLSLIPSITSLLQFVPVQNDKYPKTLAWIERMNNVSYVNEINSQWLNEFVIVINKIIKRNKMKAENSKAKL